MTDIEQVLLDRVKLVGDGEWTLIGTPQELIDEINRLLVEAEKRGYIQGGIDEILRHEEATKAVSNQLNEEG